MELPKAEGATELEKKDIAVTLAARAVDGTGMPISEGVDGEGRIFVNDTEISSWGQLSNVLSELHLNDPEAIVLIRPDKEVAAGRLVRLLGIANTVGITKYGIAALPPEEGE